MAANIITERMVKEGVVFEAQTPAHTYRAWFDDLNGFQFLTLDADEMPVAKETFAPDDLDGALKLWSEMTHVAKPDEWVSIEADEPDGDPADEESGDESDYVTGENLADGFEDEDEPEYGID